MFLVEQIETNGVSKLVVFSRKDGKKKTELVTNFRPYFYLDEDTIIDDLAVVRIEKGFIALDGSKVKKVSVKTARDVTRLREGRKTYMSDVKYANRYIVDTYKEIPEEQLKIMYWDLEIDTDNVMPDIKKAEQPITCITFVTDIPTTFVWRKDIKNKMIDDTDTYIVYYFDNEVEMLKACIDFIEKEDPDIFSGYNIKNFDFPYLINRMTNLHINYDKLSPIKKVYINDKDGEIKILGRVTLDIFDLIYHPFIKSSEMESYSLNSVAKKFLGEEKVKHIETFRELWLNNLDKLIEYNQKDVVLVKKIDEKAKIISFFDLVRRLTKCQFEDFKSLRVGNKVYHGTSKVLDCYMFSTFPNIIFPNKQDGGGEKFEGAFVLKPTPGFYKNVICMDLEALYPSIMKTFNISYETIDPNGEIDLGEVKFKKEKGFIPAILEKQKAERDYFKDLMEKATNNEERELNDQRQKAIKILGNAMYGMLGNPRSRLYKREIARTVTRMGREIILHTKKQIEDMGLKVLYADTDSNYVLSNKTTSEEIIQQGKDIRELVNKSYDEFVKQFKIEKHCLNIAFEKVASKMMFMYKKGDEDVGAAKRYIYKLLWKNKYFNPNDIHIVGAGAKRSDNNAISKDLQKTIINMIMNDKSEKEVKEYLKQIEQKIRNKDYSYEDIGFPVQIKKKLDEYESKLPIVVGANYSNEHFGTKFSVGMKPKYLPIKAVIGYPDTKYLTFEDTIPTGFKVDYDKVIKKTIKDKVEMIFKTMGWEWEDLCKGNQKLAGWLNVSSDKE